MKLTQKNIKLLKSKYLFSFTHDEPQRKDFNARLIALHDLELENFTCEHEEKLAHYSDILERIMKKLDA